MIRTFALLFILVVSHSCTSSNTDEQNPRNQTFTSYQIVDSSKVIGVDSVYSSDDGGVTWKYYSTHKRYHTHLVTDPDSVNMFKRKVDSLFPDFKSTISPQGQKQP